MLIILPARRVDVQRTHFRFLGVTNSVNGLFHGTHWCNRMTPMVLAVALVLVAFESLSVFAQEPPGLPDESVIPGQVRQPSELPGENTLPGSQSPSGELPGEDELAGTAQPVVAADDPEALPSPFGSPPILRLALDGHTGTIRSLDLSDGGRTLVSGGEDKEVHVWRRSEISPTGWLHRRTIRWPVTRGPRGRIYAARLKGDLLAFAGHGAFGYLGEIRMVDAASGELQRALFDEQVGHLQVVADLAWSPDSTPRLASIDLEGRTIIWAADPTTGLWRPKTWVPVDSKLYGEQTAAAMQVGDRRMFVAVTFLGPNHVVVPRYVGLTAKTNPARLVNWQLHLIDLQSPEQSVLLTNREHATHVRCLSATDDGRALASCDKGGQSGGTVGVWFFNEDRAVTSFKTFKPDSPPLCLDLDSQGKRLLVGTESRTNQPPRLQLWDVERAQPRLLSEVIMRDHVRSAVLDDEHDEAIVCQGNEIEIFPFNDEGQFQEPKRLSVPAKLIRKVAFSKEPGSYQVAIGWTPPEDGRTRFDAVFDFSACKLLGRGPIDAGGFLQAQRTDARWQVGFADGKYRLFEEGQPRGVLPLFFDRHGLPTTLCTVPRESTGAEDPGERPATGAVVVGTNQRGNLYVYRANDSDPPELIRQFRGHAGQVNSLSVSADGNYLVSGSSDSTVAIWNLQDLFTATPLVNRWGADFEMEGGNLIATEVREDGPLYFRGVRGGDRLVLLEWTDYNAASFAESDPIKMRQRLGDLPFDILAQMKFERLGRPGPHFQSYATWRPLATLYVDEEREWACWTPAGYYDASFNGHQRFGWQINHSIDQPVDYFRAAQFRKALERPDVMRRLLAAGNLTKAMQQTVSQIGPPPAEGAIVNQIESKPVIRLRSPTDGDTIHGDRLVVEADIEVPQGASLVRPKAFVSGVPAVSVESINSLEADNPNVSGFRWYFRLPRDPVLQLEIVAATESEAVGRILVSLDHEVEGKRVAKPRLHVIAIGVSEYRDPQIQSLDFAAKSAGDIVDLFEDLSSEIYRTTTDRLVDADATRPLWKVFAQSAAEQLAETVSPDDLVIMYLCGHGLRDRRTDQWYFVTADARFGDLMNDQYGDCIAFSDLAALAELPCRKLAILDSCHSGAVQPVMRRDDLKSALRYLQDDVVLTLTASEGDEEAAEQSEREMGRFTAALARALKGAAPNVDSDHETVSLNEVIGYVRREVSEESAQESRSQHPTASPAYLLRTLELPLTVRKP